MEQSDEEIDEAKTAAEMLAMVVDLEKENAGRMKQSMKFLEGFQFFDEGALEDVRLEDLVDLDVVDQPEGGADGQWDEFLKDDRAVDQK